MNKKIVLTGDRPTGPLHLGHYVGSLRNRLVLQETCKQFVMLADVQGLTDNVENPEKIANNILEVALDYLAVGIDPTKTTIFVQSMIPEIAELTVYYLNLVTVARLERNPTVKTEIHQKGMEKNVSVGFLAYPVSQAADITFLNAELVPVGHDQLPVIEQTVEIVRRFNRIYGEVFVEPQAMVPSNEEVGRLPGIDGKAKMSKSLGNAIYLSEEPDALLKKVMAMYTDPEHIRVEDPGKIEGNTVFMYLDIFGTDKEQITQLKEQYQRGGLGDVKVKRYLNEVLQAFLEPIRNRRKEFAKDPAAVMDILKKGTAATRERAAVMMQKIRQAMKINYF
ncbi:tryptophan--tRNA ligase [Candidatus Babeliales bacterium]|nr:tryptophan--tRNA ligase [Candidatus Babeliales bacterium]